MELLNREVLKPATVRAVEQAGPRVVQVVDRWAGGWPKATQRLEKQGRLLQVAQKQVEREEPAMDYQRENPDLYLTISEALAMYDLPLNPPA